MINKIAVALTAIILLIISLLMWAAFHYYGKSVSTADKLTAAVQQKNEAEFITQSQVLSIGIFNQIAGATLDAQKANISASHDRQVIIQTVLKTDACALHPVPAAANSSLLDHYNAVRQGAINTDTGKPTAVLPAVPAT